MRTTAKKYSNLSFGKPVQHVLPSRKALWALVICLPLSACGGDSPGNTASVAKVSKASEAYSKKLAIPPRLQWRGNFGYCGEVAMISAGLYYGQYVSQYDARAIASKNTPQYKQSSQLLPGVNDVYAARQMHLKAVEWNTATETDTNDFLAWVKQNVLASYPVLITLYTNHYLFDGSRDPNAGDPEYDHIVPVVGITSRHPLTLPATYSGDDVITFSDNGLWPVTGKPAYFYSYSFDEFQKNRAQANAPTGSVYSLSSSGTNYGIAITGVIDQDNETVPVRLTVNHNYEKPDIKPGSSLRPAPMPLTLTVEVSGLKPNVAYRLYRYNRMESVPDSAFNAHASQADKQWDINIGSGSSYIVTEQIQSNDVAVYRAVAVDAR
ncbi:hypothetical protein [Paraburkholderia acidicola]|uniref:hypothetical protein n=1 Tax=Paraburkholderia acidicola TaxID=1912599 RepID=UPI001F244FE3|nr:hypothetical protein [Paraburkholderia acidicola]